MSVFLPLTIPSGVVHVGIVHPGIEVSCHGGRKEKEGTNKCFPQLGKR